MLNFVKGLFCIYWDDHMIFIFQFVNMVYHRIDLHILKNPCIPGIKPTWSWCMSFFMCCWILFAKIFVEHFCIYVHQWYWPAIFWKSFRRIGISSSLNVWRILLWSYLVMVFVCWGIFLITASISVLVFGLFIISISSWFSLGRLKFSKNLSITSRFSILLPYSCS